MALDIFTRDRFSEGVEKLVSQKHVSYIDAILIFCEENEIELERVPKLINKKIKSTLEGEASDLNMLKEKGNKLEFE